MKSTSMPLRWRSSPTEKMAGCSTPVVMMWRRSGFAVMEPKTAVLLDSVAQEVKRISGGRALPRSLATVLRAAVMASAGMCAGS